MNFKIELCIDAGANVVSMSLGGGGFNQIEADTYKDMLEDNILLVAAAGNDGNSDYSYPASYDSVMSVAAIDSNENHASFSQYNDKVDIAAPGVGVRSTYKNGSYASLSGTSMATPHVAGVAALVWSRDTTKSAKEVWSALTQSAKDKGTPGRDFFYGHGIVQAEAAALLLADESFTLSPTATPLPCIDDPADWFDSDGPQYTCEWYSVGSRCASYGSGYANGDGYTADQACCACGGGRVGAPPSPTVTVAQAPSATPSKLPSSKPSLEPSSSPSEVCTDSPENWSDANGTTFDCNWYGSDNRCSLFGNNFENLDKTANQACCVCGGGDDSSPSSSPTSTPSNRPSKLMSDVPSILPSKPPTVSPSSPPTPTPSNSPSKLMSDVPSILPSKRPTVSPSSPPTPTPSNSPSKLKSDVPSILPSKPSPLNPTPSNSPSKLKSDVPSMGPSKPPTVSPSSPPTPTPSNSPAGTSQECYETHLDWHDIDGAHYNCAWYGEGNNCDMYGDDYERLTTANKACCECGGGSPLPSLPPVVCTDAPLGWYDSDGPTYDCEYYSVGSRCATFGDAYRNIDNGKTANEACCTCLGGEYS